MKKKIIVALSVIVVVAIISAIAAGAIKLKNGKEEKETSTTTTSVSSTTATTTTATTIATIASSVTSKQESTTAGITKSTENSKKTTTAKKTATAKTTSGNEVVVPASAKASKLISGEKAVKSWTVSSKQSSAYIEKVALNLPVYDENGKTGKTVKRYGYFAVVNTGVGAIHMSTARAMLNKEVSDAVSISKKAGMLVSVNNEMCNHNAETFDGFYNAANDQPNATVIKESKVAQSGLPTPSLVCYKNGTWEYPVSVSTQNSAALISSGVVNSVGYTYPLIWKGEKYRLTDTNAVSPLWSDHLLTKSDEAKHYYNDHTVVGQVDADTYVFAVSDGFGQAYLAEYMLNEFGVQNAYWCNGGHCSLMYVKGYGAINRPNDKKLCLTADVIGVK